MSKQNKTVTFFERILFSFTRGLSIFGAAAGILAVVIIAIEMIPTHIDTSVTLKDGKFVYSAERQDSASSGSNVQVNPEAGLDLPNNINAYFTGNNRHVLDGWLDSLSSEDQKQDFIDNLSEVISSAEKQHLDVTGSINKYKEIKLSEIQRSNLWNAEQASKRYVLWGVMAGFLFFISLMSILLVLMAIERNTRKTAQ
ncbi:hypothetical protein [Dongshaea marina]|uniref:hypothetical protein n=1 Tax=Dongshaea marina TaxID=2047966 RepID=UPI000D3E070D|nr:hypothetical protein [Dongshaea marina]